MNVLITGAGGFIGSHLVDSQLKRGYHVRGVDLHLDLLRHQIAHPRLEVICGDISDRESLQKLVRGIDIVYHLASAHLDVSLSEAHYRRVNVDASRSLLEAARNAGVKRFVHCSSVGVIGDVIINVDDGVIGFKLARVFVEGPIAKKLAVAREVVADTGAEDGVMTIDLAQAEQHGLSLG